MIGSWFPLENAQSAWAWEVVFADGSTVASGVSADEQTAGWDCRVALFIARTEAGEITDIATPRGASFCGRWSGRTASPV